MFNRALFTRKGNERSFLVHILSIFCCCCYWRCAAAASSLTVYNDTHTHLHNGVVVLFFLLFLNDKRTSIELSFPSLYSVLLLLVLLLFALYCNWKLFTRPQYLLKISWKTTHFSLTINFTSSSSSSSSFFFQLNSRSLFMWCHTVTKSHYMVVMCAFHIAMKLGRDGATAMVLFVYLGPVTIFVRSPSPFHRTR